MQQKTNKKFILIKGCAGLGNRLITLCSAIEYCKLTNRLISVDWSDGLYGYPGDNVFEKYFSLNNSKTISVEKIKQYNDIGMSVYPNEFEGNLHLNIHSLYQQVSNNYFCKFPPNAYSFLKANMFSSHWALKSNIKGNETTDITAYLRILFKKSGFPLGGCLQNHIQEDIVIFADYVPLFIEKNINNLIINPTILDTINKFVNINQIDQTIGVHIRSTDLTPTKNIILLINAIKKENKAEKIFLSTDSLDIQTEFMRNFEHVVVYDKFTPVLKNKIGLHQWASMSANHDKAEQIFKDSIVDMYLLSKCKKLFYQGNSSFSIVAKALHTNKHNCINWLNLY